MVELYGRESGEFVVNGATGGFQGQPATVRLASGEFVVVWTSFVSAGLFEVRGQLHAADGTAIGADFPVTSLSGNLGDPRVEALSTGGFVVTWTYDVHDGSGTSAAAGTALRIHAQLFDSAASKLGGELTLTSGTLTNHSDSQPVALANGAFAVSYTRSTSANNVIDSDVVVQLFDSAGAATGAATLISASSTGTQNSSALAALAGGGFVATWNDTNSSAAGDNSGQGVKAQLFDSAGAKVGSEFLVNTEIAGPQYQPSVAAVASGGFVVTWTHLIGGAGDPNGNDIKAQIYTAAGVRVGGEFTVNSITGDSQANSAVAALADGGFVVGWRDASTSDGDMKAQVFNSSGARQGIEFFLGTDNDGSQAGLVLAGLADGGFAAAWTGTDADGPGVRAQVFADDGPAPTDIAPSSQTLTENATENVAVALLSATGAVNSTFSYQILADSTGGAFRIDGDRLVVDDNARLDFETAPQATVTIRATDLKGQTYDEAIVLDVTDIGNEKRFSASDDILANMTETGSQGFATEMVALAGGGFALMWLEYNPLPGGGSPNRTVLRLFDESGAPASGEITLAGTWLQGFGMVPLANGGFLIVREAYHEPANVFSIKAQAYDSAGNAVGAAMTAGATGSGFPSAPSAVQLSTGGYAIAWVTPQGEVHGQRFSPGGAPAGAEFTITTVFEVTPIKLVATPGGGFAASWVETESETAGEAKIQFYDPAGAPAGPALSVGLGIDPGSATLLALAGGGYVFTWVELAGEDLGLGLYAVMAQLIGPNGVADGNSFILGGYVAEADVGRVGFAAHPDGGFVATWPLIGERDGAIVYGVQGQLFDDSGSPVGEPLQPAPFGYGSVVAVQPDGSIVSAWIGLDSADSGIFARVYRPANEPVDLSLDNILTGDAAANLLDGQGGNDLLYGLGEADELIGGSGNDLLDGGAGADTMRGGADNDIYVVDDAGDVVEENAGGGTDEVRTSLASASLAAYANVETLTGISGSAQTLTGNSGNNVVTGGSGNDVLRLYDGGDDTANGGAGNDNIFFIGALTSADVVNGGSGVETLIVQGPYGSLTLSANITRIENVSILAGSNTAFGEPGTNRHDYVLTTHDANFAAGVQARINAAALLEGEDFTFNGSAETDASYVVYGGKGKDTLLGGLGNDIFFYAEERFASGDTVNGGAGYDGMFLRGNYTIDFNAPGYTGLFTNIENLTLTSATDERYARGGGTEFDYNLILSDAIVGAGQELTVSGTLLMASESMILDASLESNGTVRLFGGAARDTLKGGANGDLIHGNLGADFLYG
ncbi:MAG TPA: hypothetical protein VD846_01085, partial [Allosphingosinicella sp.]|nr:hypothetical protein [Allosphingosinicella sp.]